MEINIRNKLLNFEIFNYISNGVFIINADQKIVFWNRTMENWIGIKADKALRMNLEELFPSFTKFIYNYQIKTVLKHGTTAIFSSQLHRELYHMLNGELINKHLHTTVNLLPSKEVTSETFAIFTIEDQSQLTELIIKSNKLLQELHKKEEQLLKINQNLEMLVTQRTSDLQRANDELKHENIRRINKAKELNKINKKLNEVNKELENARLKAEESDRLKSAFLANMSHEIRTPMNSIIGFSELIQDDNLDNDIRKKYLNMILKSGEHLLALVNDILDISKIEAQQLNIFRNNVNISNLIQEIKFTFESSISDKELQFHVVDKLPHDFIITTDYVRLKQILSNLISNAIKFTDEGFIELLVKLKDDQLYIHVKDSGIGIRKEYHKKIFDRFHQETQSLIKLYGGTGLGLTITKNLIELMGGELRLKSKLGKGSTFITLLPIK